MKSVLISIQPKWCELIASGKKTVEVRKTRPELDTPFKVYIYQTKESKRRYNDHRFNSIFSEKTSYDSMGKVIGEFVCRRIDEYRYGLYDGEFCYHIPTVEGEKTCLNYDEAENYGNGKPLYFWHISDLVIYDKPRELSKFHKPCADIENCLNRAFRESGRSLDKCFDCGCRITRPPQSWCYVESVD